MMGRPALRVRMLQVRSIVTDKSRTDAGRQSVMPIPFGKFVEICDLQGNIAVAFNQDDNGNITAITPGTKEAANYAALFGVKFSKLVRLPMELAGR